MAEPERIDLVQNDTGPALELHVVRQHPTAGPTALDLTGASAVFAMRLTPSGPLISAPATMPGASGASAGKAFVYWSATHLASPGNYRGQLTVHMPSSAVFPGGFTQTAPPEQPYLVVIHGRV